MKDNPSVKEIKQELVDLKNRIEIQQKVIDTFAFIKKKDAKHKIDEKAEKQLGFGLDTFIEKSEEEMNDLKGLLGLLEIILMLAEEKEKRDNEDQNETNA